MVKHFANDTRKNKMKSLVASPFVTNSNGSSSNLGVRGTSSASHLVGKRQRQHFVVKWTHRREKPHTDDTIKVAL